MVHGARPSGESELEGRGDLHSFGCLSAVKQRVARR